MVLRTIPGFGNYAISRFQHPFVPFPHHDTAPQNPRPLGLLFCSFATGQDKPDLIIINGRIIDGTGNNWYYGDIAVHQGRIQRIGRNLPRNAARIVDAANRFVSPGFIDVHAHIEGGIFERPTADNYIQDGVTTVVTGNCGNSADDLGKFLDRIDSMQTSINVASLAGHNTIRRMGMGLGDRQPTADEQRKMEQLMAKAMEEGAVGLSSGLIYLPGMYSKTDEIVGLARVAAQSGGVYATHMRNEGARVTDAIEEALTIGRQASIPVQISHFKVAGRANWGRSSQTLEMVQAARREGIEVTIDQYPYTASSTNLAVTVPDWALDGGLDSLRVRIKDPATRGRIVSDMVRSLKKGKNKDYSYAVVANYGPDSTLNGKNISEVNIRKGRKKGARNEAETILDMLSIANAQMVYHTMNEDDVIHFMRYPLNMPAADGGVSNGKGMPHPRGYGTNARVLGRYVREKQVIGFEEAIRRMTSLPAQKFGIKDRGLLREGFMADIVVFDPETVSDRSTFDVPHQFSAGIPYVIVNGKVTVEEGRHNGTRSGKTLRQRS
ncbi:MAG: D-aminoacylase [Chitinophagia bacterium]|nr:D-aminoacylase [Chitinophagia bacterium]